jgi:DNA-binding HxlR family transcriptional regulator
MSDQTASPRCEFDMFTPQCPSREAFDHIFSRWGILVRARLTGDTLRFGELRRAIGGISEKMLSQTLKVLEEERLVDRREWDEKPPRVEYSLTASGEQISESIGGLIRNLYRTLAENYRTRSASPDD